MGVADDVRFAVAQLKLQSNIGTDRSLEKFAHAADELVGLHALGLQRLAAENARSRFVCPAALLSARRISSTKRPPRRAARPRLALDAGVALRTDAFSGRERLFAAIIAGLVFGKPVGIMIASALAVAARLAVKPKACSWAQLSGAGALAGIGFTMSLFIAGEAFRSEADFEAAKIAVFIASILSAVAGVTLLAIAGRNDL